MSEVKGDPNTRQSVPSKVDTKELELPETVFVRDIENRVIQSFVLQCLSNIEGISLTGGNFFDNILGREGAEAVRGIHVEQDSRNHSVSVKAEVNILYGLSIPEKAAETQEKIAEEITNLTGLHVSCVHVIFKNVVLDTPRVGDLGQDPAAAPALLPGQMEDEYTDEF